MLTYFSYHHDTTGRYEQWKLEGISFNRMNFVVAQNATGKSRLLRALEAIFQIISGRSNMFIGNWTMTFVFEEEVYEYVIQFDGNSIHENLKVDDVGVLDRTGNRARLMSKVTNNFLDISPPEDSLVIKYRRDILEFPFFEKIHDFAVNSRLFKFGHLHATDFITDSGNIVNAHGIDDIAKILLDKIGESYYEDIINDINQVGYLVEEIDVRLINGIPKLFIREKGMVLDIEQRNISQGMFRTIAMIVYIHYVKLRNESSLLMVDDVAEGLDYERASKLSKFLLEKFEDSKIQTIITSNHNFFLDQINVKNWILLKKYGNVVKSISQEKYPKEFREFKLSGLAPFDIFSSDFFNQF